MGEEEPDYMSDDFLEKCLGGSNDVRPGLLKSRSEQRNHELLKKKKDKDELHKKINKPQTVIQSERREEGLSQPISSDNKGFSMLQKMGFKPGMGLGKSQTGIVEPIPVNVKNDRQGLGRAEAIKQILIRKQKIREKRQEKVNVSDYRALLSKKNKEREVNSDLRKSQRICHQMDVSSGIKEPEEPWFWPEDCLEEKSEEELNDESKEEEEEEEDPSDNYEPLEKLEMLTIYLRQSYFYCIWCGVQYEDEKDLSDTCPGVTRDDH